MKYLEFSPSAPLRPYVHLVWCLELDGPAEFRPPERIAPDGIVELILQYRDPMEVRFAGEAFAAQPRNAVVSQTRRFVEIRPRGSTGLVAVRFRPWGAHHFLPLPVGEFRDQMVCAEDLWDRGLVRELEERLAAPTDPRRQVALVERFLLRQLHRYQKADVEALVRAVWRSKGQVRVAQLCRETGLTERRLERIFGRALGMSPKSYVRLTRFLNACRVLRRGNWLSLTQVGHDCGYYDQAHFIGDFKSFSGLTPGEFVTMPSFSFLEVE